jgi:hypothetical protein
MKDDKPREYPEMLEGPEAFDRFRALTRRLVNVPKAKLQEQPKEPRPTD